MSGDPGLLARSEQEARSASALNHPNIVTVYETGVSETYQYIAMELVAGRSSRRSRQFQIWMASADGSGARVHAWPVPATRLPQWLRHARMNCFRPASGVVFWHYFEFKTTGVVSR